MLIKREANGQFGRVEVSLRARRADTRKPRQVSQADLARAQIGNSSENRRDRPIIRRSPIGARVSSPPRGRLARPRASTWSGGEMRTRNCETADAC